MSNPNMPPKASMSIAVGSGVATVTSCKPLNGTAEELVVLLVKVPLIT